MSLLKKSLLIALLNGFLGALFFLTSLATQLEENYGLGWLFQSRGPRPVPEEVVLVTMDTASMKVLGLERLHRKWPRRLHARLIDRLSEAGATVIAFDVFFRDPRDSAGDGLLADAMVRAGNVLLVQEVMKDAESLGGGVTLFSEKRLDPTPPIRDAAAALAPFTLPVVPLKVSRFWKFKPEVGDSPTLPVMAFQFYALRDYSVFQDILKDSGISPAESFPDTSEAMLREVGLADYMKVIYRAFQGNPAAGGAVLYRVEKGAGERALLESLVALYKEGNAQYLNYYGPPHTIRSVSYHKVLNMPAGELEQFRGKAVFVGVSEAFQWDQEDTFYTVYSDSETGHDISGVEIGATAFGNLLDRAWISAPGIAYELLLVTVWGALIGFVCRFLSAGKATALLFCLGFLYLQGAYYSFAEFNLWIPLVTPVILQTAPVLFLSLFLGYRQARAEREKLVQALSHYLPAQVVDETARAIHRIGGTGKTVYGVCLSMDAEKYTRLSEQLSPGELRTFLNDYYQPVFDAIQRHGGFISDVVGDAVLALWVDPQPKATNRAQACCAALDAAEAVRAFNESKDGNGLPIRAGLHVGELCIGDVGAGGHYEYRAVGDTVNTASRIEAANKLLGTRLLVSEETLSGVEGLAARDLGLFRLAGKRKEVRLFELLGYEGECGESTRSLVFHFEKALRAFQHQKWEEAARMFAEIQRKWQADGPSNYYMELCERYRNNPPQASWDGIMEMA